MHVCIVCVYKCVHASMCICMYVYMYACVHTCMMYVYNVILKLGFERYGGIVLVGMGNCPGGIVRGKCPFPLNDTHLNSYCPLLVFWKSDLSFSLPLFGNPL